MMRKAWIVIITIMGFYGCGKSKTNTDDFRESTSCPSRVLEGIMNDGNIDRAIYDCSQNKIADSQVNSEDVAWLILDKTSHAKYNGIGRFGGCTGTLIKPAKATSTSPANIITNGHCIGIDMAATGSLFNVETDRTMTFKYYVGGSSAERVVVTTNIIRYASMDNTDVAIAELNTTLGDLEKQSILPFSFASQAPPVGTKMKVIGDPLTGVSASLIGLKGSSCTVGDSVAILEGIYSFSKSFRFQCSIVGGNSGSSALDRKTDEIFAVINTTASDSGAASGECALNYPCEVSADGTKKTHDSYNYAQPVLYVASCFDSSGVFDRTASGCGISAD